ncbi:MFS transporter [Rhizobium sp. BK376]|uniref:MFS transporter n=1 Tax=Rhizobium sp. BK376 TaxID=2512149 RepID=UPI0010501C80|nr:MFS transporter [Rhizobium sp. BK376]TCR63911.1 DHA2 family methylenomycin A resistance protein-like MFS transporter [Rhizobium sp. BK376]
MIRNSLLGSPALAAACLGFVIISLDATVANVALGDLRVTLNADLSSLEWILNAYTVTFAGLLLSAGALTDRLGARRGYLLGIALFLVASILCGVAQTAAELVFGRALQGAGAAAVVSASMALIAVNFPDLKMRSKAVAVWAMCGGSATAAGPLAGGSILELSGWRTIFLMNVPLLLLAYHFGRLTVHSPQKGWSFDFLGQVLGIVALGSLTAGLVKAGQNGFGNLEVVAAFAASAISSALFIAVEKRRSEPMIPTSLFASSRFTACCVAGFAVNFGFYGLLFALSLNFRLGGLSAFQTGLALMPLTLCLSVANFVGALLIARFGARLAILCGLGVAGIGYLGLAGGVGLDGYAWTMPGMLLIGAGSAITVTALSMEALSAVDASNAGIAGATLTTARQVGGALGVSCFGILLGGVGRSVEVDRLQLAFSTATSVILVAFMLCSVALRTGDVSTAKPDGNSDGNPPLVPK